MKKDGRKSRKKSARPTKSGKKCARQSEQWKRLWADPVTREKMIEHNRRIARDPNKRFRSGIPDGMRKEEAEKMHEAAQQRAEEIVANMKEKGVVEKDIDPRAEKALEAAVTVLETTGTAQTKLAAARLILDFTKSKPAAKQDITVNKAEEWLRAVAAADTDDGTDTDSDA